MMPKAFLAEDLRRLDQSVEIDVAEAVRLAVEEEREECAKLVDVEPHGDPELMAIHIADKIRARSSPKAGG